ncbi:MAG: hypothetical protein SFZ24_08595 [Planctomycetota bacterium]|nr:hypothetical protein [Planctomycetota bacterium]
MKHETGSTTRSAVAAPGGEAAGAVDGGAESAGGAPGDVSTAGGEAEPARLEIRSPLGGEALIDRLSKMSKRGKLAGFERRPAEGGFRVLAFGGVYDYELVGRVSGEGSGSVVRFEMRVLKKMPIAAVVILVLTVFPGLPLTDSMLSTYFDWYRIETWWWYLPLVALMIPMMWKQYRASASAARVDGAEVIGKMAREVEGAVHGA